MRRVLATERGGELYRHPQGSDRQSEPGPEQRDQGSEDCAYDRPDDLDRSQRGIQNIPFVVTNANADAMTAIFWIEEVEHPDCYGTFLQLQYTQTVMLQFLNIDWPHISVATLTKTW